MKILMVCLGNICRSPMADGIMRQKVQERGLDIEVDSAGTSSYHVGENPDRRATSMAAAMGVDISFLRARQFVVKDYDDFDLIYVMDSSNYSDVLDLARNEEDRNKVEMIMNMADPGSNTNVPDPYWGGEDGFKQVFNMLDRACDNILEKVNG